jgi:ferric-dicitrate binding protein FerR (iron transport regulator)
MPGRGFFHTQDFNRASRIITNLTPRHEPEVIAANRRRRIARRMLFALAGVLGLAFAVAQVGWMVAALW